MKCKAEAGEHGGLGLPAGGSQAMEAMSMESSGNLSANGRKRTRHPFVEGHC